MYLAYRMNAIMELFELGLGLRREADVAEAFLDAPQVVRGLTVRRC